MVLVTSIADAACLLSISSLRSDEIWVFYAYIDIVDYIFQISNKSNPKLG